MLSAIPCRRPSLRLKITAVFATAMALLLAGLGLFVYSRFEAGLDRSLNQSLRSRTNDVRALVMQADTGLADAGSRSLASAGGGFAQILKMDGRVLDATPSIPRRSLLSAADVARASSREVLMTSRYLAAVRGTARLLASPADAQGQRLVIVVGMSLHDRASALSDLRAVMLVGGPLALLVAAMLGYGALALSLRSVETMRREARKLSVTKPGQRLPVPRARDELSRLAETLNAMLARNEAAFQRERRFVADASHELRSPLAILRAELEVALTGEGSASELRAAVVSAMEETDRLSQLAADLLTLAQVDEGKLPIEPATVAVKESFDRIRDRFSQRSALTDRMVLASAPDELTVWGDPLRIEQALSNLVDNALRYGQGDVVLSAERRSDSVELHVADSGPGFFPEFLDVAFERFSRSDDGRTSDGTGLGLSIVQSIARAHGGEAHIANRPGGGADVSLSLPQRSRKLDGDRTQLAAAVGSAR
jgi:two-component system OmpR family sensor kinase